MKRVLAVILCVCMLVGMTPVWAADAAEGLDRFAKVNDYQGEFTDVPASAWYISGVESAYEYGLMTGSSKTTFNPTGKITVAEVLVIASRMHDIYYGGDGVFEQGSPWYQVYVDYALEKELITAGEFSDYAVAATRAQFATVLSRVLPKEELKEINIIGNIPDVAQDAEYSDEVRMLYTAGVLTGSDKYGTFNPTSTIQRCEVATIVTRMVDPDQRKLVVLEAKPVALTGIQLSGATSVEVGESIDWSVSAIPSEADLGAVTWTSSNTSVATVDANGNITGVAAGTSDITATAANGIKKTVRVTVTAKQAASGSTSGSASGSTSGSSSGNSSSSSSDECYPGSDVPTYTSITGVEMTRHFNLENGAPVYGYPITRYGEYYEVVDYMGYLMNAGWTPIYENENEDGSAVFYGFTKTGDDVLMIAINFDIEEVWVVLA